MLTKIAKTDKTAEVTPTLAILVRWVFESVEIRLLLFLTLVVRFLTVPGYIESGDGVFFVRGVLRYSTYELRPHWPGYPVYIWLGQFFNLFSPNPVVALHILAVLAATFCMLPLAILAAELCRLCGGDLPTLKLAGLAASAIWALLPLSWIAGSQIYSDSLALLLALTMLLLAYFAVTAVFGAGNSFRFWLAAAALSGLLLGVRLAYLPLLLPLVYTIWHGYKAKTLTIRQILLIGGVFGLAVSLWLGWQIWQEGDRLFLAGSQHLGGHYSAWGGSWLTDPAPLTRPIRWLQVLTDYGLGGWWPGQSWLRGPVTLVWLVLLASGLKIILSKNKLLGPLRWLLLWWAIPYFFWILGGQDVTLARYNLPLVAVVTLLAGAGLASWSFSLPQKWLALALVGLTMALVTVPIALEHPHNPPVAQQLTDFINRQLDPVNSAVIVGEAVSQATFAHVYLAENSPRFKATFSTSTALTLNLLQTYSTEKRQIYLAWQGATPLPPGDWQLVVTFRQQASTDSLSALNNALELKLYRKL